MRYDVDIEEMKKDAVEIFMLPELVVDRVVSNLHDQIYRKH